MAEPQSSKLATRARSQSAAPAHLPLSPPTSTVTAILGPAALLLVAGVGLAATQPGDLGDDDDADGAAAPTAEGSTTTAPVDDTAGEPTTTTVEVTSTTSAPSETTGTTEATGTTGTT